LEHGLNLPFGFVDFPFSPVQSRKLHLCFRGFRFSFKCLFHFPIELTRLFDPTSRFVDAAESEPQFSRVWLLLSSLLQHSFTLFHAATPPHILRQRQPALLVFRFYSNRLP